MLNGFKLSYSNVRKVSILIFQLLVIAWFIHHFNIEVPFNLPLLFPLVASASVVRLFIPSAYRQWFFVLVTTSALLIVISWLQTLVFLILALSMIAICNLPIALKWRQLALIAFATFLAFCRLGYAPQWFASSTLTILVSMFMFRMLLFLYELKYQKDTAPIDTQISYFLMLPNVIFPLFPVVDYKTFQNGYLTKFDFERYQRGLYLIAKGVLFMFLYRLIYSFLLPERTTVDSPGQLAVFISTSYLLTIRLAGIFHFSVGILHLFGYQLPDIFRNHFFASSFSDLWRRLNIYWKDFIIKLFFNPLYFQLRAYGVKKAIFISTVLAFLITMFLHQYQTFWLTGVLKVQTKDLVFWGFFGINVALGSLYKTTNHNTQSLQGWFTLILKITVTFFLVSILWSIWASENLTQWLSLMAIASTISSAEALLVAAQLCLLIAIVSYCCFLLQGTTFFNNQTLFKNLPVVLLALFIISFNQLTLDKLWFNKLTPNHIQSIYHFTLNDLDIEQQQSGYYEEILSSSVFVAPVEVQTDVMQLAKRLDNSLIVKRSNGIFDRSFVANTQTSLKGISYEINRWGMRDKHYEKIAAPNTVRMAIVGGSIEMGWQIPKQKTFESLLEEQFNQQTNDERLYEILNFSVYGHGITHHEHKINSSIVGFKPNYVLIFHHYRSWHIAKSSIKRLSSSGHLVSVLGDAYTALEQSNNNLESLNPLQVPIISGSYNSLYETAIENGMIPVLVIMPQLFPWHNQQDQEQKMNDVIFNANEKGFQIIDIRDAFDDYDVQSLHISKQDKHLNELANAIIAKKLFKKLSIMVQPNLK